jgi:hypothetical protein
MKIEKFPRNINSKARVFMKLNRVDIVVIGVLIWLSNLTNYNGLLGVIISFSIFLVIKTAFLFLPKGSIQLLGKDFKYLDREGIRNVWN